jgi:hypothetical protein
MSYTLEPWGPYPADYDNYRPTSCEGCAIKCGSKCHLRWPDTPERILKQYCNEMGAHLMWGDYVLEGYRCYTDADHRSHNEVIIVPKPGRIAEPSNREKRKEREPYGAHYQKAPQ